MRESGAGRAPGLHALLPLGAAVAAAAAVVAVVGGRSSGPTTAGTVRTELVTLPATGPTPPRGATEPWAVAPDRPAGGGVGLGQVARISLPEGVHPFGAVGTAAVDGTLHVLYVADQTNDAVDAFSTATGRYLGAVDPGGFAGAAPEGVGGGQAACGARPGPTAVLPVQVAGAHQLFVGDGTRPGTATSAVAVLTVSSAGAGSVAAEVPAGGTCGTTGLAFDPRDDLVAVVDGHDPTPGVTLVSVHADAAADRVVGTVRLPEATDGLGSVVWDAALGRFLVAVAQLPPRGGTWSGAVVAVDPRSLRVTATDVLPGCSPSGLALDPRHQVLAVGCSQAAMAGGAVGGGSYRESAAETVVLDARTGRVRSRTYAVGGTTQVAYSARDGLFVTASGAMTSNSWLSGYPTPSLGVLGAGGHFVEDVPTAPGAVAVAVDPTSGRVLVPVPGYGVAVFAPLARRA